MATDIAGLFGITPQAYNQQQQQLINAEAQQFAQLDPYQQVTAGSYGAGRQLGRGIVGALGGEDPQLKIISLRQQVLQNTDMTDPQAVKQAMQALAQQNDQAGAIGLAERYRQLNESQALIQQRTAEKMTPEQRNAIAFADSVGERGSPQWNQAYQSKFTEMTSKPENTTNEIKNAKAIAASMFPVGTPQYEEEYSNQLKIQLGKKETPHGSVGQAMQVLGINKLPSQMDDTDRKRVADYIDRLAQQSAPKMQVDMNDPTAVAKANLEVMTKWEGILKSNGDLEVANRYKALQSAIAQAQSGNANADGAIIFNIGKIYDPSGAVQEGDKKTILGNPSIPQNIKMLAQRVFEGGSLLPEQRTNLLSIATDIAKGRQQQLSNMRQQYVNVNKKFGGDEQQIFDPYQNSLRPPLTNFMNTNPQGLTGGRR